MKLLLFFFFSFIIIFFYEKNKLLLLSYVTLQFSSMITIFYEISQDTNSPNFSFYNSL